MHDDTHNDQGGQVQANAIDINHGSTLRVRACVIGTGPAGLAVAERLSRAGISAVVVETGGLEPRPEDQLLSTVESDGSSQLGGPSERTRAVGGNSRAWSVKLADGRMGLRYVPLDPIDFERRGAMPNSGWPIGSDELESHYAEAHRLCGLGPFDYRPATWSPKSDGPWALDRSVVESRVFHFGASTAFAHDLVAAIRESTTCTLLHGATVTELIADDSAGPITAARCRRLDGTEFTVESEIFVLATGGIGNAHLLLASNGTRPAGLGNSHDLVGRYLQDHVLIDGGSLHFADREAWKHAAFYDLRLVDDSNVLGHLALSASAIERAGLCGLSATMFPRPSNRRSTAMVLQKELAGSIRNRQWSAPLLKDVPRAMAGLDYLGVAGYRKLRYHQSLYHGFGRGGWSSMPHLERKFVRWEIVNQAEQAPDPTNRVLLGRDVDAVGMPRARVEWKWSDDDARRAAAGRRLIADELERSGVGTVVLPADDDLPGLGRATGTAHHMGTTRMSASARDGVVDADCKVHDAANVYVAGSSVFTTSGYVNPTLTIVALADRLAGHLVHQLTERTVVKSAPGTTTDAALVGDYLVTTSEFSQAG